jgi:hypothetical protein
MRRKESLDEMVARRNKRLVSVFTRNGMHVRLVGDPEKPAVIKDEETVLSCFVKNFNLFFTKEPFSDEIVKAIKLKHEPEVNRFELEEILDACRHRHVFKLKLKGTELFLAGYNYINSEDAVGRYPVFARHKPKVYFDKSYAENIANNLKEDDYSIEII